MCIVVRVMTCAMQSYWQHCIRSRSQWFSPWPYTWFALWIGPKASAHKKHITFQWKTCPASLYMTTFRRFQDSALQAGRRHFYVAPWEGWGKSLTSVWEIYIFPRWITALFEISATPSIVLKNPTSWRLFTGSPYINYAVYRFVFKFFFFFPPII